MGFIRRELRLLGLTITVFTHLERCSYRSGRGGGGLWTQEEGRRDSTPPMASLYDEDASWAQTALTDPAAVRLRCTFLLPHACSPDFADRVVVARFICRAPTRVRMDLAIRNVRTGSCIESTRTSGSALRRWCCPLPHAQHSLLCGHAPVVRSTHPAQTLADGCRRALGWCR